MAKLSRKKALRIAYLLVLISFSAPILYYLFQFITGSFEEENLLTLLQCVLGLLVLHLPDFLSEKLRFEIPHLLYAFYAIFLYCSIFLGEFYDIFNRVSYWDVIMHCSSSLVTGFVGVMFVAILNKSEKVVFQLSPVFVALFAFCFSMMIGALWEIYEYTIDGVFGLNMQKFMKPDGTVLVGHGALTDTMKDLIIDAIGALVSSVIGYFSLKHNKEWLVPKLLEPKPKKAKKGRGAADVPPQNETDAEEPAAEPESDVTEVQ